MFSKFLLDLLDEMTCACMLRDFRWKDGVSCPHCHSQQTSQFHDANYTEIYRYQCWQCGKTFTDKTGTIFEYSPATLPEWFLCIHLVSLKCSTQEISEELEITYDLADAMVKKLGKCFFDRPAADKLFGYVEIDEAYQNAGEKGVEQTEREPRRRANNRRGRGTMETDRPPLMGIIQRGGLLRLQVMENVQKTTIEPFIQQTIQEGSTIYTDEYNIYNGLTMLGYTHDTVNHSAGEYARGEVHCNTIEGIWSLVRQWLRSHRGVSKKFLKYYVAITEFFYNVKRVADPPLAFLFQTIC